MNAAQRLAHLRWRAASHRQVADDVMRPVAERQDHATWADQLDEEADQLLEQIEQNSQADWQRAAAAKQSSQAQASTQQQSLQYSPQADNYVKDHCLAAHLAKLNKPGNKTPLTDQLAWHMAEREHAMQWAAAFKHRASTCRPEYTAAKEHNQAHSNEWDAYQHAEAKEVHRLREAIKRAKAH